MIAEVEIGLDDKGPALMTKRGMKEAVRIERDLCCRRQDNPLNVRDVRLSIKAELEI